MKKLHIIYLILLISSCYLDKNETNNITPEKSRLTEQKINNKELILKKDSLDVFKEYCNKKFEFCIAYPNGFTSKEGESFNKDGNTFQSIDNKTEIITFGSLSNEDLNPTIREEFERAKNSINVTYKSLKKDWFIISGFDKHENIVYRKTKIISFDNYKNSGPIDVFLTLMITYPKEQSTIYARYCKKIANSL